LSIEERLVFRQFYGLALVGVGLVFANISSAQSSEVVCPKKPIRVAYVDRGLYYNSSTKLGLDKEILRTLLEKTNCKYVEKSLSQAEIWRGVKLGQIDITTSAIINKQRSKIAKFSYYGSAKTYVLYQSDVRASSYVEFSRSSGKKLGVVSDTNYGTGLEDQIKALKTLGKVSSFKSDEKMFQALKEKKIGAVLVFVGVVSRYLDAQDQSKYLAADWIGEAEHFGLAFSTKSIKSELFNEFDSRLQAMVKSGEIRTIAARYLSASDLSLFSPSL
jgi:ABC-type amino acid transport substrate-binding protein